MQELPLEKIKQIGEMFRKKKKRGRMLSRKQRQESIRRQEESRKNQLYRVRQATNHL